MKLRLFTDVKDGAPLEGENPLPIFRDRQHHHPARPVHESMQEQHKKLMGYACANRILPYRMQDRYGRKRAPMGLKSAVLENEHMRAVFYLEYGGRLTSLYDKDNDRELVHNNPVFQPGNLAIRDAWLSTGIEFNCSQFGHHFLTCEPLFAVKVVDKNGEEFLRMYEYERCKGVFYQMDFHLPSGSRFLFLYTQIINPQDVPVSTYWWTNIDLPEKDGVRVFSATDEVIYYMSPEQMKNYPGYANMAVGHIPYLDALPGVDLSYPRNYSFATDYFFQIPEAEPMPWEAAAYTDGFVMYEVSTSALRYHKMFCWGVSAGGQKWRDYLARPNEGDFFEIQAGLAPTQGHGYIMEPRETIEFVQAFGCLYCKPGEFQEPEWHEAQQAMEKKIHAEITSDALYALQDRFRELAKKKPETLLHMGSGFGALELRRREKAGCSYDTKGMIFPEASIGPDQALWMSLLDEGKFPSAFPERIPAAYMVQKEWMDMLDAALESEENRNWNTYLHYGIMQAEEGDFDAAVESFKKSLQFQENVWALRNIANIYRLDGNISMSMACYERLFKLPEAFGDQAFAEEYMRLLMKQHLYQATWDFYKTLPATLQAKDRISLLAGSAAVEVGEMDFVEGLFKRDLAVIREGENSTSDIWFRYKARQVAVQRGVAYSQELLDEVKMEFNPPQEIDFRMNATLEKKKAK